MSDATDLEQRLTIATADGKESPDFYDAIIGDPALTTTIDGASTLAVTVNDPDRTFLAQVDSPEEVKKATAVVDDQVRFSLAHVQKNGDRLTLTYEDAIVAALRAQTGRLTLKPGSTTLGTFIRRLAREAGIGCDVDPAADAIPAERLLGRSLGPRTTNSWQVLRDIARQEGWRCFSDGAQLVIGSDAWLLGRGTPRQAQEFIDPVDQIDFGVAPNATTHTCTMSVSTPEWSSLPGDAVAVSNTGPGSGTWLVSKWRRGLLDEGYSRVHLIRPGSADAPTMSIDDRAAHLPQALAYDPMTATVAQVNGSEIYAVPIGGNQTHPFGPCLGVKTKSGATLAPGDRVLLVMTPQGPWITAVDE